MYADGLFDSYFSWWYSNSQWYEMQKSCFHISSRSYVTL